MECKLLLSKSKSGVVRFALGKKQNFQFGKKNAKSVVHFFFCKKRGFCKGFLFNSVKTRGNIFNFAFWTFLTKRNTCLLFYTKTKFHQKFLLSSPPNVFWLSYFLFIRFFTLCVLVIVFFWENPKICKRFFLYFCIFVLETPQLIKSCRIPF